MRSKLSSLARLIKTNKLKNYKEKKIMKHLNEKLELLHLCLCKESIPQELPQELQSYVKDFEAFTRVAQSCGSSSDKVYIDALRIFRDVLLNENKKN